MKSSLQFYPTPSTLALKAWHKFENKKIIRLLEPSAGQGSLVSALHDYLKHLDLKELRQLNHYKDLSLLTSVS